MKKVNILLGGVIIFGAGWFIGMGQMAKFNTALRIKLEDEISELKKTEDSNAND